MLLKEHCGLHHLEGYFIHGAWDHVNAGKRCRQLKQRCYRNGHEK